MTTPKLNIPEVSESSVTKFTQHNDAVRIFEILAIGVLSRTTIAQPGSPGEGDAYILPASASGTDWATFAQHDIAYFQNGAWKKITPVAGVGPTHVADTDEWVGFVSGAWAVVTTAPSATSCSCIHITQSNPPLNTLGNDGDYAHNPGASLWWLKKAGVWDSNLTPPGTGWLYFRFHITASNNADRTGIGEIEILDGASADHTTPSTQINSGSAVNVAGRGPEQAIDNNNTGFDGWLTESGGAHPFDLTVELDNAITNPSDFTGYTVQNRQADANFYPVDWTFQASTDGVTYWDIDTRTGQAFTANEKKTFNITIPPPGAVVTTQVRILINAAGGAANGSLAEWEIHETVGGANVIGTATIDASSNHPSHVPANIVDGNNATKWASADSTFPAWIRASFPNAIALAEVAVRAPDVTNNEDPRDWAIEYWNGTAWVEFYRNATEAAWSNSEQRTFT